MRCLLINAFAFSNSIVCLLVNCITFHTETNSFVNSNTEPRSFPFEQVPFPFRLV